MNARNLLVEHNLRLVAHIVKKYHNLDREKEDMISIGVIGLIKAINTYDISKGHRLVTYAARCIENELLMMLRQEKKTSKNTSLYEPIGIDKEGNEIHLLDILGTQETDLIKWSAIGAPFVCLEPWMGRCDNTGYDKELSQKPNINTLKPKEVFDKSYVISVK